MPLSDEEIENRLGFHPGTTEGENPTIPLHESCRHIFTYTTKLLNDLLPDGRSKDIAIERLEDAAMWSNKAIAQQAPLESPVHAPWRNLDEGV